MKKNKEIIRLVWTLTFFMVIWFTQSPANAQETNKIKAKGTVIDQTGNPLPGATVIESGTTNGVITDIDGKFEMQYSKGNTLTISFVGYKSSNVVPTGETLQIVLQESAIALDEAVVVGIGYGTMRKSDLTGAIASVGADEMKKEIGRAHV